MFSRCSCINGTGTATPGLCDTKCTMFYPFLIVIIISAFGGTTCMMPTFIVTIRFVISLVRFCMCNSCKLESAILV